MRAVNNNIENRGKGKKTLLMQIHSDSAPSAELLEGGSLSTTSCANLGSARADHSIGDPEGRKGGGLSQLSFAARGAQRLY